MDRLHFVVENSNAPLARQQTTPFVNGERLTTLLGAVIKDRGAASAVGEWFIGLEPSRVFLPSRHFLSDGRRSVLRCNCGDEGCSGVAVDIVLAENEVRWADVMWWPVPHGLRLGFNTVPDLRFDRRDYESALGLA